MPPRLLNGYRIRDLIREVYPEALRDEGRGGQASVWLLIAEDGEVESWKWARRTGNAALDELVPGVLDEMEFAPARSGRTPTCMWFRIPVSFRPSIPLER